MISKGLNGALIESIAFQIRDVWSGTPIRREFVIPPFHPPRAVQAVDVAIVGPVHNLRRPVAVNVGHGNPAARARLVAEKAP